MPGYILKIKKLKYCSWENSKATGKKNDTIWQNGAKCFFPNEPLKNQKAL